MTHREIAVARTSEFIVQANRPRGKYLTEFRAKRIAQTQRKAVTSTARLKDTDRFEMMMLAADFCNNVEDAKSFAADVKKCATN